MAGQLPGTARIERMRSRFRERVERLTERQRRLLAAFRFLVVFTLLASPLYLLIAVGWEGTWLRQGMAAASTPILRVLGVEAVRNGAFIDAGTFLINVTRDSTGWKSALALTALIIATPASWRRRIQGIAIGVVVIAAANVLRIVTMVYASVVHQAPYELLHTVLWRWGLTLVVLGAWLVWLYQERVRRAATGVASRLYR